MKVVPIFYYYSVHRKFVQNRLHIVIIDDRNEYRRRFNLYFGISRYTTVNYWRILTCIFLARKMEAIVDSSNDSRESSVFQIVALKYRRRVRCPRCFCRFPPRNILRIKFLSSSIISPS